MLTRKDIEVALEVPLPAGVEATWLTTSEGYELRFHQVRIFAIEITPDMNLPALEQKVAEASAFFGGKS